MLSRLVELGAISIDADRIVADLQQPGEAVFDAIVERFGSGVLTAEGELDRSTLSARVFTDKAELDALEQIVHPAVRTRIQETIADIRTHNVEHAPIVVDIPLVESRDGLYGADGLIVVDCPYPEAIRRLTELREMTADDAQRRISNQISREQRLELADYVLDNGGNLNELEVEIGRCWRWMVSQPT